MPARHDPRPSCGREPGPWRVLHGWYPCLCGGYRTRTCRDDNGGCGHTTYQPPLVRGRRRPPAEGFAGTPTDA
jgi:hypothetical protein